VAGVKLISDDTKIKDGGGTLGVIVDGWQLSMGDQYGTQLAQVNLRESLPHPGAPHSIHSTYM